MPPRRFLPLLLFTALSWTSPPAEAAGTRCPEHFAGGMAPDLQNPRMTARTTPLCFRGYATLFSGLTRTPLYSAEHLTAARIAATKHENRQDRFHEEEALPQADRVSPAEYKKSGYDRGHMAPADDMPDMESQHESFSMANMVPQFPALNRGLWAHMEETVRHLAEQEGDVYVVTGPLFESKSLESLKGEVLIPTTLFKAVYRPARQAAAVYLAQNAEGDEWTVISVAALAQRTGIDVFPALRPDIKARAADLPAPVGTAGPATKNDNRHKRQEKQR